MQKPQGMIIGQKGVKYGLISRKEAAKPSAAPGGRLAAFGGDSDSDEDNIEAQVARQAARKVADTKVQDMYAAALAEDPNAFEYDALYDSMQEQKVAPKQQERLARRPKYIASLLEQAEVRKKEQGITYERMLLKERQKEDHMYDNTEKFITSAYRRKLEEDKKWQESQKLKELEEEQNDVTKLGHMNNFYTNLTKNIAMGGNTAAAAPKSKPAAAAAAAAGGSDSPAAAAAEAAAAARSPPSSDDDRGDMQQQQQRQQQRQQEAGHQEAELRAQLGDGQQSSRHSQRQQHSAAEPPGSPAAEHSRRGEEQQQQQQQPEQPPPQQAVVAGKRKNTEDAIAAARERYLARKRQQQG